MPGYACEMLWHSPALRCSALVCVNVNESPIVSGNRWRQDHPRIGGDE